jgi:tRNA (adenine22-N1)-methyltransferase
MPRLDERLKTVARHIRWPVHADIGSDHGHLIKSLLTAGRIDRGIAIENKRQPFENSRATLGGLSAEVRFADGLAGLDAGEANGLSICGMGGQSMVRILEAFPDRLPNIVVLQPNRRPELVRQWGIARGFHLLDEQTVVGFTDYVIFRFKRHVGTPDPAYDDIDRDAALLFGPHFVRRNDPQWRQRISEEQAYMGSLPGLSPTMHRRLAAIKRLL